MKQRNKSTEIILKNNHLFLKVVVLFVFIFRINFSSAQLFFNNGATITIMAGGSMIVKTNSIRNAVGVIDNAGIITVEGNIENDDFLLGNGFNSIYNLEGDWINNSNFVSNSCTVNLTGGNQLIAGTSFSNFYDLSLSGTGIKSQQIDAIVSDRLTVNNLELATNTFKMMVVNPASNAINYTSGFVSSIGAGRLTRVTNSSAPYVFPVGSSIGTIRIRPVIVSPTTNASQTYAVRFANVDATTQGFDRSIMQAAVCEINPSFYHIFQRTAGTASADLTFTYDPILDGNWETNTHWQTVPNWQVMGNPILGTYGPLNSIQNLAWNNFTQPAFAFAHVKPIANAGATQVLECGADSTLLNSTALALVTNSYIWSTTNGNIVSGDSTISPIVDATGTYTLTVTDLATSCSSTSTVAVTVNPGPTALFTCSDTAGLSPLVISFSNGSINASIYNWDFGDGITSTDLSTSNTFVIPGTYTVTLVASNGRGCVDSTRATIEVFENYSIVIPNVFTPNGDGMNDLFSVKSTSVVKLEGDIYDRWGLNVFSFKAPNQGWDGHLTSGQLASDGTYYYIIRTTGLDGMEHEDKGSLTLMR